MKIKRKHLQILIESLLFDENEKRPRWNYSPDSDWPAAALKKKTNRPGGKKLDIYDQLHSKRVLLLNDDDKYSLEGDTHGGESHALKHMAEFDPETVAAYMKQAIELLRKEINSGTIDAVIDTIDISGSQEKIAIDDVTLGDMLNTIDQLYDDSFNAAASDATDFTPGMMNITDKFSNLIMAMLDEMNQSYDNEVDDIKTTAIDMADSNLKSMNITNAQQLINWFGKEHRTIMFVGEFSGSGVKAPMFLRTIDTAYIGNRDGNVSTLMLIRKKPPSNFSQIFGGYGNTPEKLSRTQIDSEKYSIFREMCDGIKNKTLNAPQLP